MPFKIRHLTNQATSKGLSAPTSSEH